jgi:hypothetical protein
MRGVMWNSTLVSLRVCDVDRNRKPSSGMSPRIGTFDSLSNRVFDCRPPMTRVWPSFR